VTSVPSLPPRSDARSDACWLRLSAKRLSTTDCQPLSTLSSFKALKSLFLGHTPSDPASNLFNEPLQRSTGCGSPRITLPSLRSRSPQDPSTQESPREDLAPWPGLVSDGCIMTLITSSFVVLWRRGPMERCKKREPLCGGLLVKGTMGSCDSGWR